MKSLNYDFKDESLLNLAMTQSGADRERNNERLEFLGDRVLGLAVAEMLYETFPQEAEGDLARRLASLVSAKTLMVIAKGFEIDKQIRHGHMTGGRLEHITADAMESIIGAIYMDGGWDAAKRFVRDNWMDLAKAEIEAPKDPKTALQEMAQHSGTGMLPEYEVMEEKNTFRARVSALGKEAEGTGTTKKSATVDAAQNLLSLLTL
ncbi:MAG: ribonuclease III [Rickettsiales bacterium]|jgi:ribonuclease-3|nr:ribonuclease III [Rickettsiales bacterium]